MRRWLAGLVAGCAAVSAYVSAYAQTAYPVKPIRLIVAFPAGGGSDVLARTLAQQMVEPLGQQVIVDNRPGAAGILGTELAAKAPPDGYTLLVGSSAALAINPQIHRKLPYDPITSFTPIGMFAGHTYVISVHPSVPATSMKELISIARAKPGTLNFGSAGYGSSAHLATELFMMMAGVRMAHVPYKGQAQSLTGLMSGEIDVLWDAMITTLPHVRSGRLRALAVSQARRSRLLPNLPTVAESGVPNYEAGNWFGIFAPAGFAKPDVSKLNGAINRAMAAPQLKAQLVSQGAEALTGTPEDLDALLKRDLAKFAKIVKESGARME